MFGSRIRGSPDFAREYEYDAAKYVEAMRAEQGRDGRKVVKRGPRRKAPTSVVSTAEK